MSGIALILDLLRKNPSFHSTHAFHSHGFFSASSSAAAAAASVAAGTPFAARFLFGNHVAYCDAGSAFSDPTQDMPTSFEFKSVEFNPSTYLPKEYRVELKPLLSAFEIRTFALTSLRSFLANYLPLIEPHPRPDEEDDDFLQDPEEERPVDLVTPFRKSIKQIVRETTVVTTRRVLERFAVVCVSQRMAWKLLKDVPKSAIRKSQRWLPSYVYMWKVSKTTFRAHLLGVAASWVVQVGLDTYRFLAKRFRSSSEFDEDETTKQVKALGKKFVATTLRCGASLVFASVGAGLGVLILRPSRGQWIGCAVGDLAGPFILTLFLEKYLKWDL